MQATGEKPARLRRAAIAGAVLALGALLAIAVGQRSSAAASGATASRSVTVDIVNFKYMPATLRVKAGTRVVWSNNSSAPHTATKGGSFSTGTIRPGHAAAVRFSAPGTYRYHCTIHPYMHGKIVVR